MDLELTDSEAQLIAGFQNLLEKECPVNVVRAAERSGHDPALWERLVSFGIPSLAVPDKGNRVSTYSELALLAELCGRYLTPGPILESLSAVQALGTNRDELSVSEQSLGSELHEGILQGRRIMTLAFWPADACPRQLVPAGGVAEYVVCSYGGKAVLVEASVEQRYLNCHGGTPLARWKIDSGATSSPLGGSFSRVLLTWRLLAGAALVGLADRAVEIGAGYAKTRKAFGTPIGVFQGVAHPLADSATAVAGARLLVMKAAWSMDKQQTTEAERLCLLAHAFAAETAMTATTRCVHVHGGYGSAIDYDIQLYHQRARVLATAAGDPRLGFERVGRLIAARQHDGV